MGHYLMAHLQNKHHPQTSFNNRNTATESNEVKAAFTKIRRSKGVTGGLEKNGLVDRGRGDIHGGPGHTVGGTARHAGDLLPLQTLHQCGFPVDGSGAVPLLPVVIVTPGVNLHKHHFLLLEHWCT